MSIRKVKVARQGVPLSDRGAQARPHIAPVRDNSSAGGKRLAAGRAASAAPGLGPALLRLQRKYGNRYVQKMLARISSAQKSAGQVQPKLVVNRSGDRFEQEANQVARSLAQQTPDGAALHRQVDEEEKKTAQMQPEDKEKSAQLQPEEEEKTAQTKSEDEELNRQTPEEDKK